MTELLVYGLKNCDTCRKARRWLDDNAIAHRFVDVRADGITADQIGRWAKAAGWEALLNRRGTTWRGLGEAEKAVDDETGAVALMALHPALIKRPVIDTGSAVSVGFTDAVKAQLTA